MAATTLATGLLITMTNPEYIVMEDDIIVIIRDMYPKAQYHYLVLPKQDVNTIHNINKSHIALLQHMLECGREFVAEQHQNVNFFFGYHAQPSMSRLHMHVISDDLNSPCLATIMQWNSFTTPFFVNAEDVIVSLMTKGKFRTPSNHECWELLYNPLKCNKCDYKPKEINDLNDLKKHILIH